MAYRAKERAVEKHMNRNPKKASTSPPVKSTMDAIKKVSV